MKNKRHNTTLWRRRGMQALTLLLACALLAGLAITAAARGDWQGEVVDPATPKPVVTIQGNLVTERGKPTGFYELALCVRSGRTITDPTGVLGAPGAVVSEADYALYLAAHPDVAEDPSTVFNFQYFPFSTATAAMHVNTDILTAVNWNLASVTYETFDTATGTYPTDATVAPGAVNYPRGINTDPAVQGYDPAVLSQADAFPNITTPDLNDLSDATRSVALDVENDPRMSTAEGVAEHFENNDALITLSASAPDNYPVILEESTPLVVARFSYDLKRFDTTKVSTALGGVDAQRNSITGAPGVGEEGLWMGWDKTSLAGTPNFSGKQPLTWLGESTGTFDFTDSDELAAATQADQTVWVHTATLDPDAPDTFFYYYLAAETDPAAKTGTVKIYDKATGTTQEVKNVALPNTAGFKILTQGTDRNPGTPAADYTYFRNLLSLNEGTVVVKLVNEPTFKKPTGAGGNTILFYDWDNRLIGSMTVDKGDVRAEVEAYIEENLVHPDLRPGSKFMEDGAGKPDLNKITSLQREYTYRGKYAYTPGGDDATQGVTDGKEYPLTNKLDYVFTKRVNTVLTQEENGEKVQYVHPYALNDPALDPAVRDNDAAEYPYVYGWAVVEDTSAFNGNRDANATGTKGPWKVMHDAEKIQGNNDVWTTIGVGELGAVKPAGAISAVPTVDPAAERTAPVFLKDSDPAWTDGTLGDNYAYTLTGQNSYLRFADFSDITAEFNRYEGKNTLIVKAVYEPGASMRNGAFYTAITEPAYTKWNNPAAARGGAYRVQMTLERSFEADGVVYGTTRIRMPVIQQDTTVDYKWLSDPAKGINNDLDNASYKTSTGKTETLYTQVDADNGEEITFSLALSPRQNKVDYVLIEKYGANFVVGTQRSANNNSYRNDPNMFIPDNYNYLAGDDSDIQDDIYDCDFATKEGSHGFVLYGTLGYFMEQATKCNNGEITRSAYNSSVEYNAAKDANLRMTMGGTEPEFLDNSKLQEAFLAAAKACEAHKNDPAYDCWDPNLNAAKLSYHQAQLFLIDFQANPSADIQTVAAADAQKLSFCHYHVKCSGGHIPSPPTGWKALVEALKTYNDAAPGSDDRKNIDADLGAMTLADLDSMTHLRADATGSKFTDLSSFIAALKKADVELRTAGTAVNWPNLQYAILHGAAGGSDAFMRTEAQEQYWWYAGANAAPAVSTFAQLLDAAEATYTPVTLPDADATFLPKSALLAAAYPDGAKAYLTEATPTRVQKNAWFTLTENLIPSPTSVGHRRTLLDPDNTPNSGDESYEYTFDKYADFDTFLTDFTAAYDALRVTHPADADAWWKAIQTKLQPPGDDLGDYDGDGSTKFWWRGGSTPFRVMNLSTLVECARRLNAGDTTTEEYKTAKAEWDRLKVADIEGVTISQGLKWKGNDATHPMYPYSGAQLGGDENTQKFQILTQLRQAVAAFDAARAADPTLVQSWDSIQYQLLNPGVTPTVDAIRNQRTYYWWKDGQTDGTTVSLTPNAVWITLDTNLQTLIQATYRSAFNDPGVTKSLTDAATAAGGSFWDYTRLAKGYTPGTKYPGVAGGNTNDPYDGPDELTDLTGHAYAAGDLDDLMSMLTRFRDAAKADQGISTAADNYAMPTVSWQQVQYFILNGEAYIPTTSQTFMDLYNQKKAQYGDYWWYYLDERVEPDPPKPDQPEPSKDFVDNVLVPAVAKPTPSIKLTTAEWNAMVIKGAPGKAITATVANKMLINLAKDIKAAGGDGSGTSWLKIQYYIATAYQANKLGTKKGTLAATDQAALDGLLALGFKTADFPSGVKLPDGTVTASLDGEDIALDQPKELEDLGELVLEDVDVPKAEEAPAQVSPEPPSDEGGAERSEAEGEIHPAAPETTTTTQALPDGGAVVTTVITGTDGYVTTVTTHITPGGVAATTTTVAPAVDIDLDLAPFEPGTLPQSPAATAPSTEGAHGDGNTSQVSPEPPSDEGGAERSEAEGEIHPTPDPTPDPDPDMTDAVAEIPEGEEAAAAWNGAGTVSHLSALPRRYVMPQVEAVWKKWWAA